MQFGENNTIIIEDNTRDREVLGYALAFGLREYKDMQGLEVDTSARPLSAEESVTAVYGLWRMAQIYNSPSVAIHAVRVGGKVMEDVLAQGRNAIPYLKEIALRAVVPPEVAPE